MDTTIKAKIEHLIKFAAALETEIENEGHPDAVAAIDRILSSCVDLADAADLNFEAIAYND